MTSPLPEGRADGREARIEALIAAVECEHHIDTLREVARIATERADQLSELRRLAAPVVAEGRADGRRVCEVCGRTFDEHQLTHWRNDHFFLAAPVVAVEAGEGETIPEDEMCRCGHPARRHFSKVSTSRGFCIDCGACFRYAPAAPVVGEREEK